MLSGKFIRWLLRYLGECEFEIEVLISILHNSVILMLGGEIESSVCLKSWSEDADGASSSSGGGGGVLMMRSCSNAPVCVQIDVS